MAMNPADIKLRDGTRAPVNRSTTTRNAERDRRRFMHHRLDVALAGFGVPKVRTR